MQQAEDRGPRDRAGAGTIDVLRQKLAATLTFCRYALHRFSRDGCFAASGALSYTTLVSLVPLGVIALGILSAFPMFAAVRQRAAGAGLSQLRAGDQRQAAWWFEYFAGSAAQATAIGIVGIAGHRRPLAGHRRGSAERVVAGHRAAAVGPAHPGLLDADHAWARCWSG